MIKNFFIIALAVLAVGLGVVLALSVFDNYQLRESVGEFNSMGRALQRCEEAITPR